MTLEKMVFKGKPMMSLWELKTTGGGQLGMVDRIDEGDQSDH